jgi:predicted DNA-binding transcriptional regulator YafY
MKTKKNLPRIALPRIYFIDRQIASGKYPSTGYLAKKYETSMSTISRDIEFMRDRLDAPIAYDALHRGYYYTEQTYRLPAGFSTAEEMLALGMAKNLLNMYRDTPIYDSANHLLESITAPLSGAKDKNWYENRIVVPPTPTSIIEPGVWDVLTNGLRDNKVVSFEYRGTWDEGFHQRKVRPYQLLFDNGVWFLYGYAEERKDIRMFALPRIRNAVISSESFTLPEDYDYGLQNNDSNFGVFAGRERFRFRVAFYDASALWVRERKWAIDQKIEEADDGIIISFTSTQYEKVLDWVLSRGAGAMPLEPENLVGDWKTQIKLLMDMAGLRSIQGQ